MSTIAVAPVRRAVTTSMTKTAMARPDLPLGEAPRERLAVKKLKAAATLALTARPVENQLGDLWSVFDFVNPGLLGSPKGWRDSPSVWPTGLKAATGRCASLARPYILRRMKDGQDGDRGPAAQNRNQGVLPAQPSPGRTSRARGEGVDRTARGCHQESEPGAKATAANGPVCMTLPR